MYKQKVLSTNIRNALAESQKMRMHCDTIVR